MFLFTVHGACDVIAVSCDASLHAHMWWFVS